MSEQGQVIVSQLKRTKARAEMTAIFRGLKDAQENASAATQVKWSALEVATRTPRRGNGEQLLVSQCQEWKREALAWSKPQALVRSGITQATTCQ